MPPNNMNDRASFLRRLGYLLCGIAIGFVILGVMNASRRLSAARQQQNQPAPDTRPLLPSEYPAGGAAPPPGGAPTPTPEPNVSPASTPAPSPN